MLKGAVRMKIKLKIIVVSVFMAVFMLGCGAEKKETSIVLNVDTGDTIKLSLSTDDGHDMKFDTGTSILSVSDGDGATLVRGIFVPQNSYALYYETAYTDQRCRIVEEGEMNGLSYILYSYDDGTGKKSECIGWIKGSNAGVVFESEVMDVEATRTLIGKIGFSVDHTVQVNPDYVYAPSLPEGVEVEEPTEDDADLEEYSSEPVTESPGSHETDADATVEPVDWTSLLMKIDGVEYTFPYSFKILQANGWSFDINDYLDDGETDFILEEGDYTYSTTELNNVMYGKEAGSARIFVGFKNYGRDGKNITDCGIWAMEVSGVYGAVAVENCPEVELPGGIKFGDTEEEIISVYGKPKDVEDNGYYRRLHYERDYVRQMDLYVYTGQDGGASGLLDVEFMGYD